MIVVSNTSPILNLAVVGQLDLLRQLYGTVKIPQAVYDELTNPPNQPGSAEVQSSLWIQTESVSNRALVTSLLVDLDPGESEAIALTIELGADLLLIDERLGRQVAGRFGLKFIGILGILLEAKHQGYLPLVKPVLDDLIHTAGFWVSQALYQHVLRTAGE